MSSLPEIPRNKIIKELLGKLTAATGAAAESARRLNVSMSQVNWGMRYLAHHYGQQGNAAVPYAQGFSEKQADLAIGSVFGVRQFMVGSPFWDDAGAPCAQLRGVRGPWGPGENQAACLERHAVRITDGKYSVSYRSHSFGEIPHRDCGCGFWAYWAERHAGAMSSPDVLAVIEGWGGCRTGDKGFRCSRARVVALHVYPQRRGESWRTMAEEALVHTYKVPAYSAVGTMMKAHPTSRQVKEEPGATAGNGYARGGLVPRPPAWAPPVQFTGFSTNVLCMTCHAATATNATRAAGTYGTMFHCDNCPPQLCLACTAHAPAQPPAMWAAYCSCGSVVTMPMGTTFACTCGTVHTAPLSGAVPLPSGVVTPIDALGILDAKKDAPWLFTCTPTWVE